jgi:proline iminopeptidase
MKGQTPMPLPLKTQVRFSRAISERDYTHSLYPPAKPYQAGYLKVSELHSLYYAVYGNPKGIPVVLLHGGPGVGSSDAMTRFFDLDRWHVVMFDQRGALRSQPFTCMEENTPHHSVSDIEALREHLGIKQWMVFGGSWGSALAMLYGQAHPEKCLGFILRGIFLARKQDVHHVIYGMGKVFPEAYEPFVEYIPETERGDLLSAYHRRIMDPDPGVHLPAAKVCMRFDTICSTHLPNPEAVEKVLQNDKLVLSMMRAFLHYATNDFFLQPNQILANIGKVSHLPALIVHGRWDAVDLPEMAYLLFKRWENSDLWIVNQGGHTSNDPAIATALATATDTSAKRLIT